MHAKLKIELCASMGFIDAEQFRRLKEAGVTSYHHNIETSRRNFPNICTTHTFEDKIRTIKIAQKEGMCVCSGGIIYHRHGGNLGRPYRYGADAGRTGN